MIPNRKNGYKSNKIMNRKPYFSICIPTRNRKKLLREVLNSIFAQTFKDFEIVIQDNHSLDNTKQFCRGLEKKRLIRYYRNSTDLGFVKNVQAVCQKARGKFLFLMGDDDLLVPNCLSIYYQILQRRVDNIGCCRCGTYRFLGNKMNGFMVDDVGGKDILLKSSQKNLEKILQYNATFISGWAIINEKPLIFGNGYQDCFIETVYDKFKNHNFYFIAKPLIAARVHNNLGYTFYSITSAWLELDRLVKKYVASKYLSDAVIAIKYHFINDCQNVKIYGGLKTYWNHVKWFYSNPLTPKHKLKFLIKSILLILLPNRIIIYLKKLYFKFLTIKTAGRYAQYWV